MKLQKSLNDQERKTAELAQKIGDLAKQNEAVKAELNMVREAHRKEMAATLESHQADAAKLTKERDEALKAHEEVMALPRIRAVMVPPPSLRQAESNS